MGGWKESTKDLLCTNFSLPLLPFHSSAGSKTFIAFHPLVSRFSPERREKLIEHERLLSKIPKDLADGLKLISSLPEFMRGDGGGANGLCFMEATYFN